MMNVENPEKSRKSVIVFASPILSPKGPPAKAPKPYMKDAVMDIVPITLFEAPKSVMMSDRSGGAMTNSEWFNECAIPSNKSRGSLPKAFLTQT